MFHQVACNHGEHLGNWGRPLEMVITVQHPVVEPAHRQVFPPAIPAWRMTMPFLPTTRPQNFAGICQCAGRRPKAVSWEKQDHVGVDQCSLRPPKPMDSFSHGSYHKSVECFPNQWSSHIAPFDQPPLVLLANLLGKYRGRAGCPPKVAVSIETTRQLINV